MIWVTVKQQEILFLCEFETSNTTYKRIDQRELIKQYILVSLYVKIGLMKNSVKTVDSRATLPAYKSLFTKQSKAKL